MCINTERSNVFEGLILPLMERPIGIKKWSAAIVTPSGPNGMSTGEGKLTGQSTIQRNQPDDSHRFSDSLLASTLKESQLKAQMTTKNRI
jgi:hypothetical protein